MHSNFKTLQPICILTLVPFCPDIKSFFPLLCYVPQYPAIQMFSSFSNHFEIYLSAFLLLFLKILLHWLKCVSRSSQPASTLYDAIDPELLQIRSTLRCTPLFAGTATLSICHSYSLVWTLAITACVKQCRAVEPYQRSERASCFPINLEKYIHVVQFTKKSKNEV